MKKLLMTTAFVLGMTGFAFGQDIPADMSMPVDDILMATSLPETVPDSEPGTPPFEPAVDVPQIDIAPKPANIIEGETAHFTVSAGDNVEHKEYFFLVDKAGDFFNEEYQYTARVPWFPGTDTIHIPTMQGEDESGFITLTLDGDPSITATVVINAEELGIEPDMVGMDMEQAPRDIIQIDSGIVEIRVTDVNCVVEFANGGSVTIKKRGLEIGEYEVAELCNATNPHSDTTAIRITSAAGDEIYFSFSGVEADTEPDKNEVVDLARQAGDAPVGAPDLDINAGLLSFWGRDIGHDDNSRHFGVETGVNENIKLGVAASRLDEYDMTLLHSYMKTEFGNWRARIAGATGQEFGMVSAYADLDIAGTATEFGVFSGAVDGHVLFATYQGVQASDYEVNLRLTHETDRLKTGLRIGTEGFAGADMEYAITDNWTANVSRDNTRTGVRATLNW